MTNPKIALVGSTGRVGRMVLQGWRHSDHSWAQAPGQSRDTREPARPTHIPWNIHTDGADGLARWMDRYGALDCLVVLAGTTPTTGQNMTDNVILAERFTDVAEHLGLKRILIASSSAVYGAGTGLPFSEDITCAPLNDYGTSKLRMEISLHNRASYGLEICCLRIGNVIGADALLLNATQGKPLNLDVFKNGHGPLRSYIAPSVLADVLGQLATTEATLPFTLNVAAPLPIYMDTLANAAHLDWTARTAPATAIQNLTLDCSRLEGLVQLPRTVSSPDEMISDWKRHQRT